MRHRFAPMSVVAPILVTLIMFSSLIVAFASPSHAVSYKSTASTTQAQDNLPFPSWWRGQCDTNNYSVSPSNPNHLPAYTLPKNGPNPTNYRGVVACGPRPLPVSKGGDGAPDVPVQFLKGAWTEYEWECVELSMRYMYLAYGIKPYSANGYNVVSNYQKYNTNAILIPIPNSNPSQYNTVPQPGDILSYHSNHTGVVTATNVNTSGNGTITLMEQNNSANGIATIKVGSNAGLPPWVLDQKIKNWLHHTLDVSPQSGFRDTSVQFSGTGFQANEPITITFDLKGFTVVVGRTTSDKSGAFSTTFSVPSTAQPGTYTIQATGGISKFSPRTVFYVHSRGGWPMFGYNPQHTQHNPTETVINPKNVSNLTLDWSYNTGFNTLNSSAAVVNGIVYINTISEVDAIDLTTHALIWSTPTSGSLDTYSSPAVINGVVYVGSTDDDLYALDALTGNLKWAFPALNAIGTSPAVSNGIVYFGSTDGSLYAVDATTGTLKWEFSTGSYIETSPAVANGMVYFGTNWGTFYALDATTGTVKWTYVTAPFPVYLSPTIANGVVYLNAGYGLNAFNATTGVSLWQFPLDFVFASSPAVANGVVYVGSQGQTATSTDTVYAISATTGGLIWSQHLSPSIPSTPAIANGVVYIATHTGNAGDIGSFYAFDAATGSQQWSYPIAFTYSSPVVEDGVVCIGAAGILYAFHLPGTTP